VRNRKIVWDVLEEMNEVHLAPGEFRPRLFYPGMGMDAQLPRVNISSRDTRFRSGLRRGSLPQYGTASSMAPMFSLPGH